MSCGISSIIKLTRLHQNINERERDENGAQSDFNPATLEDNINSASISVLDITVKAAKMFEFFLNHS